MARTVGGRLWPVLAAVTATAPARRPHRTAHRLRSRCPCPSSGRRRSSSHGRRRRPRLGAGYPHDLEQSVQLGMITIAQQREHDVTPRVIGGLAEPGRRSLVRTRNGYFAKPFPENALSSGFAWLPGQLAEFPLAPAAWWGDKEADDPNSGRRRYRLGPPDVDVHWVLAPPAVRVRLTVTDSRLLRTALRWRRCGRR